MERSESVSFLVNSCTVYQGGGWASVNTYTDRAPNFLLRPSQKTSQEASLSSWTGEIDTGFADFSNHFARLSRLTDTRSIRYWCKPNGAGRGRLARRLCEGGQRPCKGA